MYHDRALVLVMTMLVQIEKNICNLEDVVMRTESISVISLLLQGFSTIYPFNLLLQC